MYEPNFGIKNRIEWWMIFSFAFSFSAQSSCWIMQISVKNSNDTHHTCVCLFVCACIVFPFRKLIEWFAIEVKAKPLAKWHHFSITTSKHTKIHVYWIRKVIHAYVRRMYFDFTHTTTAIYRLDIDMFTDVRLYICISHCQRIPIKIHNYFRRF